MNDYELLLTVFDKIHHLLQKKDNEYGEVGASNAVHKIIVQFDEKFRCASALKHVFNYCNTGHLLELEKAIGWLVLEYMERLKDEVFCKQSEEEIG